MDETGSMLSLEWRSRLRAFGGPIDVEDGTGFQLVGRPADPLEKDCCSSAWMSITPDYLRLFRIPLLRGRDFTDHDNADAPVSICSIPWAMPPPSRIVTTFVATYGWIASPASIWPCDF
jgi:hypothetical protein